MKPFLRYLIPAVIVILIAVFFTLRGNSGKNAPDSDAPVDPGGKMAPHSTNLDDASLEPSRTKGRKREPLKKPTILETRQLLRDSIVPLVDLPQQAIPARVKSLNRLIAGSGTNPNKLKITFDDAGIDSTLVLKAVHGKDVTVLRLLQLSCSRTSLKIKIDEGQVIILSR